MSVPARSLSGPHKAALVLLTLDADVAGEVLRHLEEAEIRKLAVLARELEPVPAEAIVPTFEEFERKMKQPSLPHGAAGYLRKLAATSLGGERADQLWKEPEGPVRPIDALKKARAPQLADLLADEHPQVAAVILAQLSRDQAAKVLQALPVERQSDLLHRIATLEEVPAEMVALASEALAKALAASGALGDGDRAEFDGVAFAAGLLNEMGPAESEKLLGVIGEHDGKIGPKIREAMFTFEDLRRLQVRQLQVLMREVQTEQLLTALKTASEELREHFLSSVSSRAATTMREDLAAMPPTRLSDVERAQREIVDAALRLAAENKLQLPGGTGEKLV